MVVEGLVSTTMRFIGGESGSEGDMDEKKQQGFSKEEKITQHNMSQSKTIGK